MLLRHYNENLLYGFFFFVKSSDCNISVANYATYLDFVFLSISMSIRE